VWIGTGDDDHSASAPWGDGIYRSDDAGGTWTHAGLKEAHHIARIVIHPHDTDIVYAAVSGRLWGASDESGVFKTVDRGRTWTKILFLDNDTGVTDLAMDPSNHRVLIAAAYQRRPSGGGFNGGGPAGGLYKTVDGGTTWRKLLAGLPGGAVGRIGLDLCRSASHVVYARMESAEGGVFRSDDSGETWSRTNGLNPAPHANGEIRVDPTDERRVYLLAERLYVSDDAGASFLATGRVRGRATGHAMWIDVAAGCGPAGRRVVSDRRRQDRR
jgi:hypothetical protein